MWRPVLSGFLLIVLAMPPAVSGTSSDHAEQLARDPALTAAVAEVAVVAPSAASPHGLVRLERESGNLLEETVGDWQWHYQNAPACRGNIYRIDTEVNLYEHRLRLYTPQPISLIFAIYRGTALTGQYMLVDQVLVNVPAGDQFFSSGPRNIVLEAGWYYFLGAAFSGTVIYGRRDDPPPQVVSFGQVETSVPGGFTGYPPTLMATNSSSGYPPMHQIIVTGTPPDPVAPGAATSFSVTAAPGALRARLDWVNPTLTVGGNPLAELAGARLYRDDTLLVDLTGLQIGQSSSYTDDAVPQAGFYAYEVVPYNSAGNGEMVRLSQWVGHGTGVYDWDEVTYDWLDIAVVGTDTGITGDDALAGPFPLGFSFPFWPGEDYDAVSVCSNGFLTFTPGDPIFLNSHLPLPAEPNGIVAPHWDDLDPSAHGQIYYYHDVARGRFIVQWTDVPCCDPPAGYYTFQAVLYPDGTIDFLYKELTPGVPGSTTVGAENATGMEALEVCYNGFGGFVPRGQTSLRLFHPGAAGVAARPGRSGAGALLGPTLAARSTVLVFRLSSEEAGRVRLALCDAEGRALRTLFDREVPRGEQTVLLDLSREKSAGVYYIVADGALRAAHRLVVMH